MIFEIKISWRFLKNCYNQDPAIFNEIFLRIVNMLETSGLNAIEINEWNCKLLRLTRRFRSLKQKKCFSKALEFCSSFKSLSFCNFSIKKKQFYDLLALIANDKGFSPVLSCFKIICLKSILDLKRKPRI